MPVSGFCSSCDSMELFDSGFGWSAWSFARTWSGLTAFDAKFKRRFSNAMVNSIDGCTRWFLRWAGGQWPVFIVEDGGKMSGVGNAYTFVRSGLDGKCSSNIGIMWDNDICGSLNRGSGGWSAWRRRHSGELDCLSMKLVPYMQDDLDSVRMMMESHVGNDGNDGIDVLSEYAANPGGRHVAAKCVNVFFRNKMTNVVNGFLRDPDSRVRLSAVVEMDLGTVCGVWKRLLRLSDDPDWMIRRTVFEHAVERLRYEDMMADTAACMGRFTSDPVRRKSAEEIFDDEFVGRMKRLADDADPEVRLFCAVMSNRLMSEKFEPLFNSGSPYASIIRRIVSANTHDDWFMPEIAMRMAAS